ncbi:NfrA family protein [Haematospirillum sp. 15-248]|uniref:NfrA family protein n=1 Tax=Haematospirillum sp. 15-248 TaxID=2723107 RepID=UPI001439E21F|nr:tetratricopeptide repeat protein [Haematospirillum sp. 15-248]
MIRQGHIPGWILASMIGSCLLYGPCAQAQQAPTAEKRLIQMLPEQNFMEREWLRHRTFPYEEKARALIQGDRKEEALQELEKGLTLIPEAHVMRWRATVLAAELQKPADVLRLSTPLTEVVPDFSLLRLFRATALQTLGHREEAAAELTQAMGSATLSVDEQLRALELQTRTAPNSAGLQKAMDDLEALTHKRALTPQEQLAAARILVLAKRDREAAERLLQLTRNQDTEQSIGDAAAVDLGFLLLRQDKPEEAYALVWPRRERLGHSPAVLGLLAEAASRSDHHEQAIELYKPLRNSSNPSDLQVLADLLARGGLREEAAQTLEAVAGLRLGAADRALSLKRAAFIRLDAGQEEQALELFIKALELDQSPDTLNSVVLTAISSKRIKDAGLVLQRVEQEQNLQTPNRADVINAHRLSLCAAHLEQNTPEESVRCLEELRHTIGDTPALLQLLAEAQRRAGDTSARTKTLETLAQLQSDKDTLVSLADARWAEGNIRGSAEALEQAAHLDHEAAARTAIEALVRWKGAQEWSSVERVARRILEKISPENEAVRQALTALAESGTATQKNQQRKKALQDLYHRGLISVDQRLDLAFVLLEDKETKEAVRLMWETLQHEQSPRVHVLLATALDRANRKGPAADFYERSLLDSSGPRSLSTGTRNLVNASLGYLYYDTGRPDLAASHWKKALSGQYDPVLQLRLAQALLGAGEAESALQQIDALEAAKLPDDLKPVHLETWARALAAAGRDQEAIQVYQTLNTTNPTSGRRLEQAVVERRQGQLEQAFHTLESAYQVTPDNEALGLAYAYAARDMGDHEQAEPLLSHITGVNADQLSAREDLGYTRAALGDTQGAQDAFSDVIEDERLYAAMRQYTPVQNRAHIWGLRRQNSILNDNLALQGYTTVCPQASSCRRTTSPVGDALNEAQGGVELAWRPPSVGYRDGRTLAITGRLFWGTINGASPVPDKHTTQAGAGLRWKPLREHDFNLAAERLFSIGSKTEDNTLVRVSYGLSSSMDIPPDEPAWTPYYSFYVDAGRFLEKSKARLVSSELRLGGKWRMGTPYIAAPFALIGGSHTGTSTLDDTIARSGIGLHWRLWYNDSASHAHQSYIDVTPRLTRDITKDGQGGRQTRFIVSVLARF